MPKTIVPVLLLLVGCNPTSLTFSSAAYSSNIRQATPLPTVVSIGDGDTLRLQDQEQSVTVRLACIDAPERDQPGGQEATARLRQLLPRGQSVRLRVVDRDRYGRTVAEVYQGEESVNLRLVQEGMAVVYPEYLDRCRATRDQYLQAEQQAHQQGIGFWSQENPVMPWDWRQQRDSHSSTPDPVATPIPSTAPLPSSNPSNPNSASALPACVNQDCDCKDFHTQAEAQRVFEAFPGDPFRLDGDQDGRVCEQLP